MERDAPEALKMYIRAAEMGDVAAMSNAGALLVSRLDVCCRTDEDFMEGLRWIVKAAEKGSTHACMAYGRLLV